MAGVDGRGGGVETSSMSVEDSGGGGAQDGQADQGLNHKGGYMYYFSVEWITGHFWLSQGYYILFTHFEECHCLVFGIS